MLDGQKVRKTKTSHIVDHLLANSYTRKPISDIQNLTKQQTKTLIIARYKMLERGTNFRNSRSILCPVCKKTDNEDHRMNHCIRYKNNNFYDHAEKPNYNDIYSTNTNTLTHIITKIEKVWNTRNANGTMLQ